MVPDSVVRSFSVLNSLPDALVVLDAEGQVVFSNRRAEDLFGYPHGDFTGRRIELLVPDQHRQIGDFVRGSAARQGLQPAGHASEVQAQRRDGTRFQATVHLGRLETDGSTLTLATVHDISHHRDVEHALRESEERYRKVTELSRDQIFIVDRDGRLEYVNPCAAEPFGLTPDRLIGHMMKEFFPSDLFTKQVASVEEVFATGRPLHRACSTAFPDREAWLDTWLVPLYEEDGHVRAVLGVSRDLTERKELEQRLAHAQRMEAIGQLAGGVAHDFNNLLTAIQGYSDMILEQITPDKPIWADLREIQKVSDRAARLVQQLLAFSRRQVLHLAVVDLNTVVRDTQEVLERILGGTVTVEIRLVSELWPIEADPLELKQILLNLASNARDAMSSGGKLVIQTQNAEVQAAKQSPGGGAIGPPPGRYAALIVSDTGEGMNEATQERIFEPFFTTKEVGKGTGLGLSSVYGTVEQLKGHIRVDSTVGKGSTFVLYFPETTTPAAQAPAPIARVAPAVGRETILLVEDDASVRKLASHALRRHGYTVLESATPLEALGTAGVHANDIKLVVSAVMMPEMTGRELVAQLRADLPHAGVLYVSGYPNGHSAKHADLDADLLPKPFKVADLLERVREILDRPGQ